jgi:hypothetical protein
MRWPPEKESFGKPKPPHQMRQAHRKVKRIEEYFPSGEKQPRRAARLVQLVATPRRTPAFGCSASPSARRRPPPADYALGSPVRDGERSRRAAAPAADRRAARLWGPGGPPPTASRRHAYVSTPLFGSYLVGRFRPRVVARGTRRCFMF